MSLIIPCKNEEGNIKNIVERVKKDISFPYEIIFIDDKSDDNTLNLMNEEKNKNSELKIKIVNGPGKGKSAAIKAGIEKSDCLYSIIVDADMTVSIKDINLFYNAIKMSYGDLINGSRLIYKPYAGSMKTLNYFGNIFFGVLSSYISSHLITDTLCGSKCFKTKNFKIMEEYKIENNISDIWGDFNILFSCNYYGLKSVDLPVRYYEREAGETKMVKRFYFFLNMLKTCYKSFQKFKIKSFRKI